MLFWRQRREGCCYATHSFYARTFWKRNVWMFLMQGYGPYGRDIWESPWENRSGSFLLATLKGQWDLNRNEAEWITHSLELGEQGSESQAFAPIRKTMGESEPTWNVCQTQKVWGHLTAVPVRTFFLPFLCNLSFLHSHRHHKLESKLDEEEQGKKEGWYPQTPCKSSH